MGHSVTNFNTYYLSRINNWFLFIYFRTHECIDIEIIKHLLLLLYYYKT